jgi:hypothetical protein
MVKTHQNLEFLNGTNRYQLSIFSSRCKHATTRGLRKSSSLTNGMSPAETKSGSESMALRPEVYICPTILSMRPSWALR